MDDARGGGMDRSIEAVILGGVSRLLVRWIGN